MAHNVWVLWYKTTLTSYNLKKNLRGKKTNRANSFAVMRGLDYTLKRLSAALEGWDVKIQLSYVRNDQLLYTCVLYPCLLQ